MGREEEGQARSADLDRLQRPPTALVVQLNWQLSRDYL
jgi:hypothetical protein